MLAAHLVELAVGLLVDELGVEELPEVEQLEEIRRLVAELLVRAIRRLPHGLRPVAWILDGERGGEDHELGGAVELACGEQHAADARVYGEPGELLSQRRQLLLVVDRAELEELLVPVAHLARR